MATKVRIPSPTDAITGGVSAFDDLADAIANPSPDKPLRNAIGQSGRLFCDFVGATPAAAKALLGPGFASSGLLCKPYWDGEGYDAPVENSPFTGGQCVGATYSIGGTQTDGGGLFCGDGSPVTGGTFPLSDFVGGTFTGPITSVTALPLGSGCRGGANGYFVRVVSNGGATTQDFTIAGPAGFRSYTGFSVAASFTRVGGGEDCGNPPGDLEPGDSPPPTPTFPPGEEPGLDPDDQPFFFVPPIPSPIPGEDPIDAPTIAPPGGGGGGSPPGPPAAGEPEEGTEPEGEAPEGEEIYALVIDFLTTPLFPREIEDGLFVSPCRVFLGTEFGLDLYQDGRAMRSGQAVFAEIDGLTRWKVSASVGYTVRVTPYYREKAS
jgi:hypothetical protein